MAPTHARDADKAAEGPELVRNNFKIDVLKRAVVSNATVEPCACGKYQYFSQKCGHLYKSVYLKCGKFHSSKTGEPTLCRTGYQRVVDVCTAVVPFYCATCRKANVRWKSDPSSEQDPADQPEDQSQPDTLTFTDRQQEQAEAASTYPVPQSHNALVLRDRDEKENEKADEDVTQDEEETKD
ncbi:hypothetical protein F5Y02DRAFT_380532 [Annulohypoxylon stygium]|nr:hypothetical protein F5Y02DRAFT_380532 [Annulohypoxylon stygium]